MKKIINYLLYVIRQQATLSDFHLQVKKIAVEFNEHYIQVNVCMKSNGEIVFEAYINNFTWVKGRSQKEVLKKLREYKNGNSEKGDYKDVLI